MDLPRLVSEDLQALFVKLATLELAVERLVISLLLGTLNETGNVKRL